MLVMELVDQMLIVVRDFSVILVIVEILLVLLIQIVIVMEQQLQQVRLQPLHKVQHQPLSHNFQMQEHHGQQYLGLSLEYLLS